jgi:hypothetical protein
MKTTAFMSDDYEKKQRVWIFLLVLLDICFEVICV